jgi:hypothetical protein
VLQIRIRIRIRIRMNPHDFSLLDPHSKCGFQMRMRIRDRLCKNSADDKEIKILKYFVGLL